MIRLTGIGHVLLRVSDVARSREFYSTVLGFDMELYCELPNARALFRQGRHDRDQPLAFER